MSALMSAIRLHLAQALRRRPAGVAGPEVPGRAPLASLRPAPSRFTPPPSTPRAIIAARAGGVHHSLAPITTPSTTHAQQQHQRHHHRHGHHHHDHRHRVHHGHHHRGYHGRRSFLPSPPRRRPP